MSPLLTRLGFAALPLVAAAAPADVVKLRSGGEIRGVLVEPVAGDTRSDVTVETLSGGIVSVAREDVEFVTRRPRVVEEHEGKAKSVADTVAARWELAEWCRENRLEEQQREQLRRIVELEPDHAAARAALGQTNYEGEWLTRDEIMEQRGLVAYKSRWITPQELDLVEKTQAEREREQAWFTEIRKLKAWLRGTAEPLRRKGLDGLKAVADPDAVPALEKFFRDDSDPETRKLYVSILAAMPGEKPVKPLVTQSLHDVDYLVRFAALDAIDETRRDAALPYYLQGLRNELNDVVRRAGQGLERTGDERAIPDLVKSLITTHRYRIQVRDDTPSIAFSTAGTFGPGGTPLPPDVEAALRTGALPFGVNVIDQSRPVRMKTITVAVNHENPEVLSALRKITGQSFGFDERTWRLWWAAKKNGAG